MREGSPPQHQPLKSSSSRGEKLVRRSPTPRRPKSPSRSPKKADVRDRRVKFEDERGGELARAIPETYKEIKERLPQREGESRSKWKSRLQTQMNLKRGQSK